MRLHLLSWLKRRLEKPIRTLASVDAYALWVSTYPPYAHNRLMQIEQEAMECLMPPLRDRTVLDLACGTGRYGLLASSAGARHIIGADNSRAMLRSGSVPAVEASMTCLPFTAESFDVVICGLALGHLPPDGMRLALAEMARVLHRGGEGLFSDFHPFLYLRGGRRTFTTQDGRSFAVEHYPHLPSDYFNAIQAAGMTLVGMEEARARIGGSDVPAALVIRCRR